MIEPLSLSVGYTADRERIWASAGDREMVIDALRAAYAQGRLSRSELDRRAVQVLESRTYAALAEATAGIPPATRVVAARPRHGEPARGRRAGWKVVAWVLGLAVALPGLSVVFLATYYGSFFVLLSAGAIMAAALGSPSDRRHRRY